MFNETAASSHDLVQPPPFQGSEKVESQLNTLSIAAEKHFSKPDPSSIQDAGFSNVAKQIGAGMVEQVTEHSGEVALNAALGATMGGLFRVGFKVAKVPTALVAFAGGAYMLTDFASHIPQWGKDISIAYDPSKFSSADVKQAEQNLQGLGRGTVNFTANTIGAFPGVAIGNKFLTTNVASKLGTLTDSIGIGENSAMTKTVDNFSSQFRAHFFGSKILDEPRSTVSTESVVSKPAADARRAAEFKSFGAGDLETVKDNFSVTDALEISKSSGREPRLFGRASEQLAATRDDGVNVAFGLIEDALRVGKELAPFIEKNQTEFTALNNTYVQRVKTFDFLGDKFVPLTEASERFPSRLRTVNDAIAAEEAMPGLFEKEELAALKILKEKLDSLNQLTFSQDPLGMKASGIRREIDGVGGIAENFAAMGKKTLSTLVAEGKNAKFRQETFRAISDFDAEPTRALERGISALQKAVLEHDADIEKGGLGIFSKEEVELLQNFDKASVAAYEKLSPEIWKASDSIFNEGGYAAQMRDILPRAQREFGTAKRAVELLRPFNDADLVADKVRALHAFDTAQKANAAAGNQLFTPKQIEFMRNAVESGTVDKSPVNEMTIAEFNAANTKDRLHALETLANSEKLAGATGGVSRERMLQLDILEHQERQNVMSGYETWFTPEQLEVLLQYRLAAKRALGDMSPYA